MEWVWRGEHYSATSAEYNSIKAQLASESFPPAVAGGPVRSAALPCGLASPRFHTVILIYLLSLSSILPSLSSCFITVMFYSSL